MKLVDYKTFIRMPAGTIFAPYKPCVLEEELSIKVDAGREIDDEHWFNGVMHLSPWIDDYTGLWEVGDEEEAEFEVYDGDNNDYRDYKMFLIFDEKDIDKLIEVLQWVKNGCKEEKPHCEPCIDIYGFERRK